MVKKIASELKGKIQTVLGPISPETLGVTLPHEHIIANGTCWYVEPEGASDRAMSLKPVSTDFLWWLRYHFFQNRDDLVLDDEATAIKETSRFKIAGGSAICEVSNHGLGRDPEALARISRATGLHIVMGSGYYLRESMPDSFIEMTEKDITEQIVHDITVGAEDTGIRAGLIGEIGCSWPLDDREKKSLRAAARAQQLTGANLNFHPGQGEDSAREALDLLEKAGADPRRVTISHIDRAVREVKNRLELARRGATLEYDLFGREGYYPIHKRVVDMPNDATRINEIRDLIEAGFINQIFISHDIWNKTQLTRYGGWGYDHILRDVVPVMRAKGMTGEQIRTIMVDNPRRALTFI
jgi:phosphotriesterase-related protein